MDTDLSDTLLAGVAYDSQTETQAAQYDPELAWSTEQAPNVDTAPVEHRHGWKATIGLAMSIAATTTVGALMLISDLDKSPTQPLPAPPAAVQSPLADNVAPPAPRMVNKGVLVASENSTARDDNQYIDLLVSAGMSIYSRPDAIAFGHTICSARAQGAPESKVIEIVANYHPEVGWGYAPVQVRAAEAIYCSQYFPAV